MSFEYQVILLAVNAPHSKLAPIDVNLPHSMLPIANRPLISYQLDLLEKAGFQSVLVVLQEQSPNIENYINEIYKGKIEVEFFLLKDDFVGTCEILFKIRDKIRTNFIVMNGNLIADHCFVRKMADMHRSTDSTCTILLSPPLTDDAKEETQDTLFTDYIALDERNQRVLMLKPAQDIEERLDIPKSLLRHFPNLTIYNNLQDLQFYIFSRWVIDLIVEDRSKVKAMNNQHIPFSSIKKDLIPYLLRCQVPNHKRALPATAINHTQDLALQMSTSSTPFNPSYHINQQTQGTLKCSAYLIREGYRAVINTIANYQKVNYDIARNASTTHIPLEPRGKNNWVDPTVTVAPTSVGADCVVGSHTVIGAKSSVKKSIIGKHCKFGQMVKIENSIIMDHVVVEDGCSLNGAIIGHNVNIKSKVAVKMSQVASGTNVNREIKNNIETPSK